MSEVIDSKVLQAHPQNEPPVGTVDKLYKGPSRKAVVTGVVFQFTLLTISILGTGAVLLFSFARDKDIQAIQADLKSLRLDVATMDSVLTKAAAEGWKGNLKQRLEDNTALFDQLEAIAHGVKEINETIITNHKDLVAVSTTVAKTLERVTTNVEPTLYGVKYGIDTVNATLISVDQQLNSTINATALANAKLDNLTLKVHEIYVKSGVQVTLIREDVKRASKLVNRTGTEVRSSTDFLFVKLETITTQLANVSLRMESDHNDRVRVCEATAASCSDRDQTLYQIIEENNVSLITVADTFRNISTALMFEINDALNKEQVYASHTVNRMFEETNNSFDLVLNALQNVSTNVISDLNRLDTRYEKNIRRVRADAEGVSQKLDLLLSDQMNIVKSTAEIRAILISENNTDRISLIVNNTELNNRDVKENMHILDIQLGDMAAKLENVSSEMEVHLTNVIGSINKLADQQVDIGDTLNKLTNGTNSSGKLGINIIEYIFNVTSETQRMKFRQKEVTQSILLDIDRTSQKLDNMTDWLLSIFNNTKRTETREHEIMTTLSVIIADILNVSLNVESYHADIRMLEDKCAQMDQYNTKHAKEIKERTVLILTQLSQIQTDLLMDVNITRHTNNKLSRFTSSLSRNLTDMSDTLLVELGQYSQNLTDMTNMIASQSESHSTRLSSITAKLGTIQNTVNNRNTHMDFIENNLFETMTSISSTVSTISNSTSSISDTVSTISNRTSSISDAVSTISDRTVSISDAASTINDRTVSISDAASTIIDRTVSISDAASTISTRTVSISDAVSTISNRTLAISDAASTISNRTLAISDAVSTISNSTMSISSTVSTINNRTSSISDAVSTISNRTSSISSTVSTINNRTSSISSTVSTISNRTSSISSTVWTISNRTSSISDTVWTISNRTSGISSTVSSISATVSTINNSTSAFDGLASSISTMSRCSCPYHTIRLVNSTGSDASNSGRLEVCHNGRWGTVCDDKFDNTDATVACRMLGYRSGVARLGAHYGEGTGPIWIDNLSCRSTHADLFSCRHGGLGNTDCTHAEDAGVICA